MKNRRLLLLAVGAAVLALSMFVVLAMTPAASAKKGGKGKISWSQNPVRATVAPGGAFSATVVFSSTTDLKNVTLDATPSLSGTTTISPTAFASITAGLPYSVEVSFAAPSTGERARYNGVLHLRTGRKNHPSNLKLRFAVPVSSTSSLP
ncbi:MAG: hypothetical protein HY741_00120 [Chloroflexi bacterium]|nr:hypothetical protein [Chloroflexota bacterium]